jgi:hypothetical protein
MENRRGLRGTRRFAGKRPAAFTPAKLPGLVAWYRGDHVVTDGSSNVQTATDLGPNGYTATQGGAGNRPAFVANGGLSYWNNLAATSLVATTAPGLAQPFEVWAVVRPASATPGAGGYIFDSAAGNQTVLAQLAATGVTQVYAGVSLTDAAQITVADHIVRGVFNGASSIGALDGGAGTTGNAGAQALGATFTLCNNGGGGLANGFVGRWYETVLVLPLSVGNATSLTKYFKARYSIP